MVMAIPIEACETSRAASRNGRILSCSVAKPLFAYALRVWNGDPLPEWQRSIAIVRDALDREARWTRVAARELRTAERLGATHPKCALQHLRLASDALRKAEKQRERASVYLLAAGLPGASTPGDEPLLRFAAFRVLLRGNARGAELDAAWERLNEALAELPDNVRIEDSRRPVPGGVRLPRRFLMRGLLSATERIDALFKRRQRSGAAAPEDAPRRISRGRAPPSLGFCPI